MLFSVICDYTKIFGERFKLLSLVFVTDKLKFTVLDLKCNKTLQTQYPININPPINIIFAFGREFHAVFINICCIGAFGERF